MRKPNPTSHQKSVDIIRTLNDILNADIEPHILSNELNKLDKEKNLKRPSEDPVFQKHAEANQWKTRRDRGIEWRKDVFEFVKETYGDLIRQFKAEGRPLTQADIKAVDLPLWQKFQQEASKRGAPQDIDLPTQKDAVLQAIDDPFEQEVLRRMRGYHRNRRALEGSLKK